MPDVREVIKFGSAGALTVGAGKDRNVLPFAGEFLSAAAVVGTAPTGGPLVVDLLLNGTSIFTTTANRPTVAAGQTRSGVSARPDVTAFAAGDVLELSVVTVGVTVAGSDLVVDVALAQRV